MAACMPCMDASDGQYCPNCPWFEPKYRPCDTWFNRDCMRDWQGRPVVTCRAMI